MRFVLYSEKTVAQCLTAINARMHVKETSTRPALDGWVEKGGTFSLALTAPVVGNFNRRTTLTAKVERQSGITVIEGGVSSGASRQGQAVVFAALAVVALAIMGSGNVLFGALLIPFAAYLYIPLQGDYLNSGVLLDEVERTLKAKAKPPKKLADAKTPKYPARSAAARAAASASKPAAPKRAPAKKPAASKPAAALPPADEFPPTDEFPVSGGTSPLPSGSAEPFA